MYICILLIYITEEMRGYIYKVTNLINNKVYIGQTINFKKRKSHHLSVSFNPKNSSYDHYFHRSIRKYGKNNFSWEVICILDIEDKHELKNQLDYLEKYYIKKYNSFKDGYNLTKGGDGGCLGRVLNKETRLRISNSKKGMIFTESHKKKLSLSKTGCKHNLYGIKGSQNKTSKPIIQYDKDHNLIREFISLTEASKTLSINIGNISSCLKKRHKSAGGFIWEYKI